MVFYVDDRPTCPSIQTAPGSGHNTRQSAHKILPRPHLSAYPCLHAIIGRCLRVCGEPNQQSRLPKTRPLRHDGCSGQAIVVFTKLSRLILMLAVQTLGKFDQMHELDITELSFRIEAVSRPTGRRNTECFRRPRPQRNRLLGSSSRQVNIRRTRPFLEPPEGSVMSSSRRTKLTRRKTRANQSLNSDSGLRPDCGPQAGLAPPGTG